MKLLKKISQVAVATAMAMAMGVSAYGHDVSTTTQNSGPSSYTMENDGSVLTVFRGDGNPASDASARVQDINDDPNSIIAETFLDENGSIDYSEYEDVAVFRITDSNTTVVVNIETNEITTSSSKNKDGSGGGKGQQTLQPITVAKWMAAFTTIVGTGTFMNIAHCKKHDPELGVEV